MQLALITAGLIIAYWAVVIGGWAVYVSRPARQARARQQHLRSVVQDPSTGDLTMEYEAPFNVVRIALILLVPPLLLVGWTLMRG